MHPPGKEFNFALPIGNVVVRASNSEGAVIERPLGTYGRVEDIPTEGTLVVEGVASDTSVDQYKGKFSERAILGMVDCVNSPPVWKSVERAKEFVGIDIDHSKHWTDQIGRATAARAIYDLTEEQRRGGYQAPIMWVQAEIDLGMSHGRDLARSLYRGSKLGLSVWGYVKEGHVEVNRSTGERTEHFDLVNLKQIAVTSQPVNKNTLLREVRRSMIGVTMPEMYSPDATVGDGMVGIAETPAVSATPAGVLPGVGLTSAALADVGIEALAASRAHDASNPNPSTNDPAGISGTKADFTAADAALAAANANLRAFVTRSETVLGGEGTPEAVEPEENEDPVEETRGKPLTSPDSKSEVERAQRVQSNNTGKRGSGDVAKPAPAKGSVKGVAGGSDNASQNANQTKQTFPKDAGEEQDDDGDGDIEDLDDQNEESAEGNAMATGASGSDGAAGGTGEDPDARVRPIAKRKSKPTPKMVGRSSADSSDEEEGEEEEEEISVLRSAVADQTEVLRALPGMFESVSVEISRAMDELRELRDAVADEVAALRGEWAAFKDEGVGRRGVIGRSEDWEPRPIGAELPPADLSRLVRELAKKDKIAATNLLLGRLFEPEPENPELPAELQEIQDNS